MMTKGGMHGGAHMAQGSPTSGLHPSDRVACKVQEWGARAAAWLTRAALEMGRCLFIIFVAIICKVGLICPSVPVLTVWRRKTRSRPENKEAVEKGKKGKEGKETKKGKEMKEEGEEGSKLQEREIRGILVGRKRTRRKKRWRKFTVGEKLVVGPETKESPPFLTEFYG